MDKVIDYNDNEENEDFHSDELSDNELDDETREYLLSMTRNARENTFDIPVNNDKPKKSKSKKSNNSKTFLDMSEPKKWQSKRMVNKKKSDGTYVEQRKFKPRPLPVNFVDNLLKELNSNNIKIEKTDFPSLEKSASQEKPKLQGAWGKKITL